MSGQHVDAHKKKEESSTDLFVTLTSLAPALAVYLYFLGFTYLFYFFHDLGLSLMAIEVPINYVFVYSYGAVIYRSSWNYLLWLLLGLAVVLAVFCDRRRFWVQAGILFVILSLFPVSANAARSYAENEAKHLIWHPRRLVQVTFKEDVPVPDDLRKANDQGELILVMQTSDKVFAIHRTSNDPQDLPMTESYAIEFSVVSDVKIIFQGGAP